jgi:hypothetical protein
MFGGVSGMLATERPTLTGSKLIRQFDLEEEERILRPQSRYRLGNRLTSKEIKERNTTFMRVNKINLKRAKEMRPPAYKPPKVMSKEILKEGVANSYTLLL